MQTSLNGIVGALLTAFLWPGDYVRRRLGIDLEQDGGIVRSFVNMVFWGAVTLALALRFAQ